MKNKSTKQINDMIANLNKIKKNMKNVKEENAIIFMDQEIGKIAYRAESLLESSKWLE